MNFIFENFDVIFTVMMIFALVMFVVVIFTIVSPRLRSKMMKKQIKATKYMIEDSQEDIEDLASLSSNIAIRSKKRVLDVNGDALNDIATKNANINKDAISITAKAIKDGLTSGEVIYCKHCGKAIDDDSEFCKFCGKKQNK